MATDGEGPVQERAMVTEISLSNYRSIGRNVTVRLDPLTALVGQNGSGKSNFLDAFRFVSDCMEMGLGGAIDERNGIEACRRWNRSSGGQPNMVKVALQLALPEGPASYTLQIHGSRMEEYWVMSEEAVVTRGTEKIELRTSNGELEQVPDGLAPSVDKKTLALPLVGGDRRFRVLFDTLRRFAVYSIYPNTLRMPQKYSAVKPMHRHGDNWASILKDQDPESWRPDLVTALSKLTEDIDDVRAKRVAGHLVAQFHRTVIKPRGQPGKWFDAYQESDGTLRVAGIVTALLQDPALPVIGIEEPELTVHPGAIGLLYDYLVQASTRSQVIVTTHSPDLLDLVDTSSVRVVARNPKYGTSITALKDSQRSTVEKGLMTLGEVLRSEGLQQELPFEGD